MSYAPLERPRVHVSVRPSEGEDHPVIVEAGGLTELVARAAEGNPEAWATIVERFTHLLWVIARSHRLNHDDAADVVQNTWLRLLENLGRIDNPEAVGAWLTTTARREALNVLRRQRREIPVDQQYFHTVHSEAPELGLDLLIVERDAFLRACFRQLPDREQRLLRVLFAYDRPSYSAIATALQMSIGSIGPTRMRALKRLFSLLQTSDCAFRDSPARPAPQHPR